MKSTRRYFSMFIEFISININLLAVILCLWGANKLYHYATTAWIHAGAPPMNLSALMIFYKDPYLLTRLEDWGIILVSTPTAVVLAIGALEGTWYLLRRI